MYVPRPVLDPVVFVGATGYCMDERSARAIQTNLEKVHAYADKCDSLVDYYNKAVAK